MMRLQLIGRYTLEEFHSELGQILDDFKKNDVTSLAHVNIYFQLLDAHGYFELQHANGDVVDHLVYKSRRQRKRLKLPSEFSVLTSLAQAEPSNDDENK